MKRIFFVFFIIIFLTSCSFTESSTKESFAKNISYLDNKCIGWGFHRTQNGAKFTEHQHKIMEKYNCIYQDSSNQKVLYLTFDEGYENGYTALILDTLREKNVTAAFFVTGDYVKSEPELVSRMAREGHIIGNHTLTHPSVPSLDEEQIKSELIELDRLVYSICKKNTKYFRPPKGEYSERTLALTSSMGYINTFWSFAYVDWNNDVSSQKAKENILKSFHSGTVLLLHAVSRGNAEALPEIIDNARKEGFVFKSLDEYKI